MKINNLLINGFGKIENKNFTFGNKINLIIGKNESGKSTFTKCLQSMFFGISRNKNGKIISDYDKYKPWNNNFFSAKIDYTLDNGEKFEVFRDFEKRQVRIFNSNLDDVSADYSIDKARNSNYFIEQTNISEDIFTRTAVVSQSEVKLDKIDQNIILQKVSNLVSTGDDTISFNKIIDKLNKKQLDEVGTIRSTGKPINLVMRKIEECNKKLENIDIIKNKEDNLKTEISNLKLELQSIRNNIQLLKELQNIKNNEKVDYSKIDAIQDVINDYELKISNADKEVELIKLANKKKTKFGIFIFGICFLFAILYFALSLSALVLVAPAVLFCIGLFLFVKKTPIPNTKSILENEKADKLNELDSLKNDLENIRLSRNDYIRNKYGDSKFLSMQLDEITFKLSQFEKDYSNKLLHYNTLMIDNKNISSQIEEISDVEEELAELNEQLAKLNSLNNSINIAKEALNEAYDEMKSNITPEFTNYLSNTISKVSNNKYQHVKLNDEDGLVVQLSNGDYISSDLLSIGTIDQMYISLRLAVLKEVSQENLPIILDEAFVYFDNERLENILKYISEEFEQVFILSCSNREKDILDRLNIDYLMGT